MKNYTVRREIKRFFLRFVKDDDGDIGVMILNGLITVVKYKESTIWYFFQRPSKYQDADKYQGTTNHLPVPILREEVY